MSRMMEGTILQSPSEAFNSETGKVHLMTVQACEGVPCPVQHIYTRMPALTALAAGLVD